jgi:transposase
MKPVRRFEVFTGGGHRREWSDETRPAIIAESYSGAESVSAVARRHALAPSQLFTWRREFRRAAPRRQPALKRWQSSRSPSSCRR